MRDDVKCHDDETNIDEVHLSYTPPYPLKISFTATSFATAREMLATDTVYIAVQLSHERPASQLNDASVASKKYRNQSQYHE